MLWPSLNFQQSGKASCLKGLWSKLARNLRDECSKNVCLIWYILLDSLAPLPTKVLVVDPSPWPGVGSTARVFASNVGHGVGPPRTDNEYRARMMIWWKSIFTYVGTYCCLPSSLEILPWHSKFKAHPPTAHVCSVLCLVIYDICSVQDLSRAFRTAIFVSITPYGNRFLKGKCSIISGQHIPYLVL